eukprot:CAMPEP_0202884766 /NCGR_PEP_ID=MMETSP1391-20130828/41319_1 /ASSEMBLY_ACC=CAM_ASM_000867 /TAXON_ID=1034604 /ORGANISM="Chlamydomonas leiostraca, Strain SAG 11-49" /LENGTH=191 /DNA_ID=CAMNT_0049567995 /DNA_START=378 /DNA_END=953 /DNA_ORIENTATION=-
MAAPPAWHQARHATAPRQPLRYMSSSSTQGSAAASSGDSSGGSSSSSGGEGVYVVPFPKLSHTMTCGQLVKWHKAPGDQVRMYDVLYELATEEIAEPEYRVGDFAGNVVMLVEAQEEGWLAARLVQEGQAVVKVGTPVGVVCEDEDQAKQLSRQGYKCPTGDVYDEQQPRVNVLTWQSYLKTGKKQVKCMG